MIGVVEVYQAPSREGPVIATLQRGDERAYGDGAGGLPLMGHSMPQAA